MGGVNYRPRRLRGVCETREPGCLGVPGTMILDIVEGVDALDATSASAACFADLEETQVQNDGLLSVHLLFALSSHFGLQFRLARELSVRLFAQAPFVEILFLHRVEDRTELRCEIGLGGFSLPLRNDRRLTQPVCVNGSHLRHVLLGSEDKFVIYDICRGVC